MLSELYEYLILKEASPHISDRVIDQLNRLKESNPEIAGLIEDGLALVKNNQSLD